MVRVYPAQSRILYPSYTILTIRVYSIMQSGFATHHVLVNISSLITIFHTKTQQDQHPNLIRLQRRAPLARRQGEARLYVHLLHAVVLLVKVGVHPRHVLHAHAVRHHLQRFELLLLDPLQQVLPVHVHGCLAVADQADAALHEGACEFRVSEGVLVTDFGISREVM